MPWTKMRDSVGFSGVDVPSPLVIWTSSACVALFVCCGFSLSLRYFCNVILVGFSLSYYSMPEHLLIVFSVSHLGFYSFSLLNETIRLTVLIRFRPVSLTILSFSSQCSFLTVCVCLFVVCSSLPRLFFCKESTWLLLATNKRRKTRFAILFVSFHWPVSSNDHPRSFHLENSEICRVHGTARYSFVERLLLWLNTCHHQPIETRCDVSIVTTASQIYSRESKGWSNMRMLRFFVHRRSTKSKWNDCRGVYYWRFAVETMNADWIWLLPTRMMLE